MLIPMKNPTKLVMLGLSLVLFAVAINLGNAYAQEFTVSFLPGAQLVGCEEEDKCLGPSTITVPVGATVTWINKDGAGHTVTGATDPKDPATWSTITIGGVVFDSSFPLIKPEGEWSFTFTEEGEFPYVCQVHPWNIGKVIVGGAPTVPPPTEEEEGTVLPGQQIDLIVSPGLPFERDEYKDVTLTFKSKGSDGKPIVHTDYMITITRDGKEVFKNKFHDHDGVLELKVTPTDMSTTVSKPEVDDLGKLITGPFGVMGKVLNENGNYEIKAEITGIEFKPLPSPITQNFNAEVVPEFPLTAILPMLLAFVVVIAAMRIRARVPKNAGI